MLVVTVLELIEANHRIRVLYEMYIDLKSVGNKLTGGNKNV